MKRKLFISLGDAHSVKTERILLSYWWDYATNKRSRFLKKLGAYKKRSFDFEAWERSQTHLAASAGVSLREAWKDAWRSVRLLARIYDGYKVI